MISSRPGEATNKNGPPCGPSFCAISSSIMAEEFGGKSAALCIKSLISHHIAARQRHRSHPSPDFAREIEIHQKMSIKNTAGGRPMPRPLQADGDRSAGVPADGAKSHPAGEALRLVLSQCPPRSAQGRGDAGGPRRSRPDRGAADCQPGRPSRRDGGRAGRDRVQRRWSGRG
jgi:hypothetical protein